MNKLGIPLLLIIFISACSQEIEIDLPPTTPKLVVQSFLHPYDYVHYSTFHFKADITQSTDINDTTKQKIVRDALVIIGTETENIDTLVYDTSFSKYTIKGFKPVVGKKYFLKVSHPDMKTVVAYDIIPSYVKIDTFSYIKMVKKDELNQIFSEVTISFDDPMNEKNFYEVEIQEPFTLIGIYSDDPVIKSESYYPSILSFDPYETVFLPFSDELFNGKKYDLKILYKTPIDPVNNITYKHAIIVHLNQ